MSSFYNRRGADRVASAILLYHKNAKKNVKSVIFMRNLSCNFATEQCRLVLRQWRVNPKEIEGKNRVLFKWGIEKNPSAPLLLQKIDINLFSKHSHLRLSSFVKKPNPIDCNGFSQYLKLQRRHLIHIEEFCPHPDTVDQKFFQLQINTIGEKWSI